MSSKNIQSDKEVKKRFGNRIRMVREAAGLSQEAFANKLMVTPATINRYEKGHRIPDAHFIDHLVMVFQVDYAWLFTGEGPMRKEKGEPRPIAVYPPEIQHYVDMLVEVLERGSQNEKDIIRGKIVEEYRKYQETAAIEKAAKKGA